MVLTQWHSGRIVFISTVPYQEFCSWCSHFKWRFCCYNMEILWLCGRPWRYITQIIACITYLTSSGKCSLNAFITSILCILVSTFCLMFQSPDTSSLSDSCLDVMSDCYSHRMLGSRHSFLNLCSMWWCCVQAFSIYGHWNVLPFHCNCLFGLVENDSCAFLKLWWKLF
jgi:hypothetical protein